MRFHREGLIETASMKLSISQCPPKSLLLNFWGGIVVLNHDQSLSHDRVLARAQLLSHNSINESEELYLN